MLCYACAKDGDERQAVALCRSCYAGLCLEHLRDAASAWDNVLASCAHDTWVRERGRAALSAT
jgi:hypothetical protein